MTIRQMTYQTQKEQNSQSTTPERKDKRTICASKQCRNFQISSPVIFNGYRDEFNTSLNLLVQRTRPSVPMHRIGLFCNNRQPKRMDASFSARSCSHSHNQPKQRRQHTNVRCLGGPRKSRSTCIGVEKVFYSQKNLNIRINLIQ